MKEIKPISKINAVVEVPGSKSLTQRALITAALANGESTLLGPLDSEDTRYIAGALRAMGIVIEEHENVWLVNGQGGLITAPDKEIYLGNNGTATRFLTSVAALGRGKFQISGDERMSKRPIQPLISALQGWGVDIKSLTGTDCPPLEINADGLQGGSTRLPEGKSSQYLSSLLLVAPYARKEAMIEVEGQIPSLPYVSMTIAVMAAFDIMVAMDESHTMFAVPQAVYRAREFQIEGDASSASYFWAAAAITGGRVTVANVPVPSLQGDTAFVALLARMGCNIEKTGQGLTVTGPEELKGIEVDMGDWPDVVPTLAVLAARAHGRTVIKNVAHLRIKECDRLNAVATELAKMGVRVQEEADTLIIEGQGGQDREMHGAEIDTYNDHRMAMSFAVAGLAVPGVRIKDEECVAKSFPDFFARLDSLYNDAA